MMRCAARFLLTAPWLPLVLSALLLPACAEEQPARNTIQHGVIAKEDLLGTDGKATWYYLQTVVDVPYATGFTFTGEQSYRLEKVRFDVQEKVLYARRAYEWVVGADGSSSPEQGSDPKKAIGAPIAAFAVEKHFDIIRDYNSATGEEINRIVENEEDRPWYERKFMRVDWSKNLLPDFEFLVHYDEDAINPLRQEAIPYYVSNPDDLDAMRIGRPEATTANPRPTATYLDVTTKLMVTPDQATYSFSDGDYRMPACYLAEDYGPEFSTTDCSAQEIKLRHSFMRADTPARDYDPLVYDDKWMERFGYFSVERQSYDIQYAETDSGRVRLTSRFNIWQKTLGTTACSLKQHYVASSTDAAGAWRKARTAADAACEKAEGRGSSCALTVGLCTLTPSKRGGLRPITYYLSVGFPETLKESAREAVASWDEALRTTAARLLFPDDNPTDQALLARRRTEVGPAFVLKDNGCSEAAVNAFVVRSPELATRVIKVTGLSGPPFTLAGKDLVNACSALEQATAYRPSAQRFVWQRIGDLRYSMLYWTGLPTRAGLLGYGPSQADPETGETIQANLFIYGAVHDQYTARSTDIVGLLTCKDEACIQSYVKGVPIADWVALQKSGASKARTFTQAEVEAMAARMQTGWMKAATKSLPAQDWQTLETLRKSLRARSTALAQGEALGLGGRGAASRLKPLKGTALEAAARTRLMQAAGLGAATTALPSGADSKLSLYNWAGPGMLRERRKALRHLASRRVEHASFWDDIVLGLALRYKESGKTREQIFADLRARLFRAVAEHEIGHTLGLRHNFAATYDALNYHPSYWKLRSLHPLGKALPRYRYALTDWEKQGNPQDPTAREGLGSYQYSSVMDYGARFNSDIAGLGYYDQAAIKFGYGQLVEVFDKVSTSNDDRYLLANLQTSIRWGEPMLYTVSCDGKVYRGLHYTEYPRLVGGRAGLARPNRIDVPLSRMTTKKLSTVAPGCTIYGWGALWDSDVPLDDKGRLEVPFRFCSDEFESASPECSAFDSGADPYEQTQMIIDGYNAYYLFNNLKLDRLGFSYWGYLDRIEWRYFEPLRSSMQFYTLIRGDLTGDPRNAQYLGDSDLKTFFTADDGYGPWTVAVDRSLDFFLDVLATPEAGEYWINNKNLYDQVAYVDSSGNDLPADLTLTVPSGKYLESSWDFDSGYFWYDKMTHVGVFHDKYLALWMLTDPETWFLGRDTSADLRQYAINFYRLYADTITRHMRGMLTEDWSVTGHWAAQKKLIDRDFTSSAAPPSGAYAVNPQIGYSVQFWAALLGVALIPQTFDTSFLDSCRVWLKGSADAIIPTKTPVCFDDPFGQKTYCAVSYTDKAGVETGVGAAMIAHANQLKATYTNLGTARAKLKLTQYIDSLDMMRSITGVYAAATAGSP